MTLFLLAFTLLHRGRLHARENRAKALKATRLLAALAALLSWCIRGAVRRPADAGLHRLGADGTHRDRQSCHAPAWIQRCSTGMICAARRGCATSIGSLPAGIPGDQQLAAYPECRPSLRTKRSNHAQLVVHGTGDGGARLGSGSAFYGLQRIVARSFALATPSKRRQADCSSPCSFVAVLTTIGIVAVGAVRDHPLLHQGVADRVPVRLHWSPQTAMRADQVARQARSASCRCSPAPC